MSDNYENERDKKRLTSTDNLKGASRNETVCQCGKRFDLYSEYVVHFRNNHIR